MGKDSIGAKRSRKSCGQTVLLFVLAILQLSYWERFHLLARIPSDT